MKDNGLEALFAEAGEAIHRQWERTGFEWEAFPQIAAESLQDERALVQVSADDVYQWALTSAKLPKQHDIQARFAQPPLTAFSNDKFHIAFLCWTSSTTAIHQHAFEGAFRVFLGSSLQATYRFTEEQRWSEHLLRGRLDTQSVELLQTGAVCAIEHGARYIHSIYHLDQPSITLIVRTHGRPDQPYPQYSYEQPGFAVDEFHKTESLVRARQVISHLHHINHPRFVEYVNAALLATDAFGAYRILHHVHGMYPAAELPTLLGRLGEKFGESFAAGMPEVLRECNRTHCLVNARQTVTDPEGRFFLALLLNVTDASQFRELLAKRFPNSEPQQVISRWVTKLLEMKDLGIEASSFSGMLVRGMLSGLSAEDMVRKLAPILRTEAAMQTVRTHGAELAHLFRPVLDVAAAGQPSAAQSVGPAARQAEPGALATA